MPKCFIVTFGWNTEIVVNLTVRQQVVESDIFYLVIPTGPQNPKTQKAINTLREFFSSKAPGVSLDLRYVDIRNYYEGVINILNLIVSKISEGYDIFVCVSGGMRILILMTYTAALIARNLFPGRIKLTKMSVEGLTEPVDLMFPPLTLPDVRDADLAVLEVLYDGVELDTDDIAEKLGKSKSTIHRAIRRLERLGLIRVIKRERKFFAKISKTGQMYLEVNKSIGQLAGE